MPYSFLLEPLAFVSYRADKVNVGPLGPLKAIKLSSRLQNERKFGRWEVLPGGGRRYWLEVTGRLGWRAIYVKEVSATESTLRFWQEIYDDSGRLVEIHEKFPVDKGHQKV